MKIQNIELKPGDNFQVGQDTSIYTFLEVTKNERYGYDQLVCKNNHDDPKRPTSIFRIDNMIEHELYITKL